MNSVNLIGRLARDVEIRYTQTNNTAVANFTIAVNRAYVKEGEERQADFISVVAWGKTAEFCQKYFRKGMQVGITGRIQTRNWDDDQGQKHYVTEVVAENVYFADSKKDDNQVSNEQPQQDFAQQPFEGSADDLPF